MPQPKNAPKDSAKRTPERGESKEVDLGQKLAAKRSQDFKSKIDLWNEAGGGVVQQQDAAGVSAEAGARKGADTPAKDAKDQQAFASSREDNSKPRTPKTPAAGNAPAAKHSSARRASREVDPQKKAWVRRRSKTQTTTPPDVKADISPLLKTKPNPNPVAPLAPAFEPKASRRVDGPDTTPPVKRAVTPKKRIVSDGHWRKDRPEKTDAKTPEKEKEKEITPRPKIVRRSVVNVGLKVPPSVQNLKDDTDPEPVRRRPLRRQPRSRSTSRERDDDREATPDYESSGVKVYIKRRRQSRPGEGQGKDRKAFNTSESSFTAPSSVDQPSSVTDITIPEVTPTKTRTPRTSTDPHIKTTRRVLSARPSKDQLEKAPVEWEDDARPSSRRRPRSPSQDRQERPRLSRDANIPKSGDESSEKPAREPPRPIPRVYGTRIEGWLATMTDDPFTESKDPSLVPEALDLSGGNLNRLNRDFESEDDARLGSGTVRRRKPRTDPPAADENDFVKPASGGRTAVDDRMDSSSRSLRRDGAQRSTPSKSYEQEDDSTPLQGVVKTDSREHQRRSSTHNGYGKLRESPFGAANKRLSTIASVSTLREHRLSNPEESVLSRASDGDEPTRHSTVLRRRLTKHSDLMSVLSLPREEDHAIAPARSVRTKRPRHDMVTPGDLMNEVTTDELKYQRELRTLVDGVVPVLLQYVLAQNEKSGSRKDLASGNSALTQPIIDMGVVLERLKASHKRIPMHDTRDLLLWAENAGKVYADYLNVWRLGFNDIVVNLAPAEQAKPGGWDNDLQRNEHGDLLDGDGERVDVAYLLKRPLVRIKDLSKTLHGINQIRPSASAAKTLAVYEDLVAKAKQRTNDERARLEDEAAAGIDPSRARNPRSLAPLAGVTIDRTRCVRARDFFDLEFFHSSGQQLDCRIELIIRDDPASRGTSGDILFCEISPAGRWLLFPPVLVSNVSCRKGDRSGEIVVMIRGLNSIGTEWRELMSLLTTDEQCTEWIDMIGTSPSPPRLTRRSSFNMLRSTQAEPSASASSTESELPIGEQARTSASRWDDNEASSISDGQSKSGPRGRTFDQDRGLPYRPPPADHYPGEAVHADRNSHRQREFVDANAGVTQRPGKNHARSKSEWIPDVEHDAKKGYGSLTSPLDDDLPDDSVVDEGESLPRRPTVRKRTSSVPSMDLPTVHKLRKPFDAEPPMDNIDPQRSPVPTAANQEPASAPAKLQKRPKATPKEEHLDQRSRKTEQRTISQGVGLGSIPSFTPAFMQRTPRSSSPLKHEYEPSTATESSETELSDADDSESITSESSAEEGVSTLGELRDFRKLVYTRPRPRPQHQPQPQPQPQPRPRQSSQSTDADTIRPSESASQAPYRGVPTTTNGTVEKSVACIFTWSDRGSWEPMHPEECHIVVTPGLIEAFDLAQANAVASRARPGEESSPSIHGVRPLVALELTPWVPLRRGTAVDISIRSPPTADSVLRKGNNVMFRSRNSEDCERLYGYINRARIDNPTWRALQNARGPPRSNWAEVMDRRNAARPDSNNNNTSSWFKTLSRKGSYRSKGSRSASVAGSQSSLGTINSAISAIRQFGGGSKIFNIAKSSIMSKQSTRSSHTDSLSSGAATPQPVNPSLGTPVGITNIQIRLYVRESTTKWRDLGNARLTILVPPRRDDAPVAEPKPDPNAPKKRISILDKKGNLMLDVVLGEASFERVARTGIAVSVWEEGVGPNGEVGRAAATGGVLSSKSTVYMIQMKSERDAAFTFSMVGKLRY